MQATIASESSFTRITSWTARLKSTVTTAAKQTTGGTSSMKLENGAGNTTINGGMSMSIAGMSSMTGMITIMTTTGTKS